MKLTYLFNSKSKIVHCRPTHPFACIISSKSYENDFHKSCDRRCPAYTHEFFKAKFKTKTKKKKDHANLREHTYILSVHDRWQKVKVRANQKARDNVS